MDTYLWTQHAEFKMKYYRLSKQKVLGVVRRPDRVEKGIVEDTVAAMQPVSPKVVGGKKVWKQEIWVMYQMKKTKNGKRAAKTVGNVRDERLEKLRMALGSDQQVRIISAWRYPGVSPKDRTLPEEIIREIEEALRG
jgi:hypothetical protein